MNKNQNLTERLTIKVTKEDLLQIQETADREKLRPSVWARSQLLKACNPILKTDK